MSVVHDSIIVEKRLAEIFEYMPSMKMNEADTTSYDVTFGYGSAKELNAFLKSKENESVHPYPLIWLLYPLVEKHNKTEVILERANFILAVNNKAVMLNEQRINETYTKVLMPLYDNMRKCLKRANISNLNEELELTKFPNYGSTPNQEEHVTTDVWDALKVVLNVRINNVCLKAIKL